ncbi:MAG TPA: cysteine desulfurase family protein [Acidimicrobiales bacterium]|nr:cysteine desulfurase family protein [Acidimicrobiales bacterium]
MPAYLDHAATTPLRPEAREAMLPFLGSRFGNPSGSHAFARQARRAVDEAREEMAEALGAQPGDVVFTGSGTEADNLAVTGAVMAARRERSGAVALCSAVEHEAVLASVHATGGRTVPVGGDGRIDLSALEAEARAAEQAGGVAVISVMLANNEVGVVQPLGQVVELCRRAAPGALVHTDAVQAFPWLDVAKVAAPADLVAVSAHKFGGPQGVGALVIRGRAADADRLAPVIHGGGQERGRRSGTHNVAGIVGMAAAASATVRQRVETVRQVTALRDRLADGLLSAVPEARETAPRAERVAGSCHLLVPGVESEALLFLLDQEGVGASAGSACASGAIEPSHVLVAMGVPAADARGALRLSLGWCSTDADVEEALRVVPAAVAQLAEPVRTAR